MSYFWPRHATPRHATRPWSLLGIPALVLCLILVGITSACSPDQLTPPTIESQSVKPYCQAGYCCGSCEDSDPHPSAVGLYISSDATADYCADVETSDDLDLDNINDYCESRLALAFEPRLDYTSYDDLGEEPAYAVRPLGYHNGRYMVLIMYMLSEYIDRGTSWCGKFGIPASWACGHYGDSEAITLRVRYEPATHHWVVDAAWYSQHEGDGVYCNGESVTPYTTHTQGTWSSEVYEYKGVGQCEYRTGSAYPPSIAYVGNPGSQPVAHVSIDKHANYMSESDCQGGNPQYLLAVEVWADDCNSSVSKVVDVVGPYRNVGSSESHGYFLDCTESEYAASRLSDGHMQECYWSGNNYGKFGGWQGPSPMSDPYSDRLTGWGF